jgi:hypothetical protein
VTCIIVRWIRSTYSSTSASRGPRVNCLVRGATASFSQRSIRGSDDGGNYLVGGHHHLRVRVHDSVLVRYFVVELASFAGLRWHSMSGTCHRMFPSEVGLPHSYYSPCGKAAPATSARALEKCDCVLINRLGRANEKATAATLLTAPYCCFSCCPLRTLSVYIRA